MDLKTSEYQRNAVNAFIKKQKEKGFIKYSRDIKPEWKPLLDNLYNHLKNSDFEMIKNIKDNSSDSFYGKTLVRILKTIKKYSEKNNNEPISHSKLSNNTTFLRGNERNDMINELKNRGIIEIITKECENNKVANFYKFVPK